MGLFTNAESRRRGLRSDEDCQNERRNPSPGTTSAESIMQRSGSFDGQWINPRRALHPSWRTPKPRRNHRMVGERKHPAMFGSDRVSDLADERPREFRIRNRQGRVRSDGPRHRDGPRHHPYPSARSRIYSSCVNRLRHGDRVTNCFARFDPIAPLPWPVAWSSGCCHLDLVTLCL